MNNFFILQNFLDKEKYRRHFVNEYLSKNTFHEKVKKYNYVQFRQHESYDSMIDLLDKEISAIIPFLKIDYISIFKHIHKQPIHIDGHAEIRSASLNLPLINFETTTLNFYRSLKDQLPIPTTTGFYFENHEVELVETLTGTDEWVLVNSGCPHNIDNVDFYNPRYTLCIRFKNNPKFTNIVNWLKRLV